MKPVFQNYIVRRRRHTKSIAQSLSRAGVGIKRLGHQMSGQIFAFLAYRLVFHRRRINNTPPQEKLNARSQNYKKFVNIHLAIKTFCLVLAILAAFSYTRPGGRAYAAPNAELNFQARLLAANGAIAPDGNSYSVQFKLYNVASGGTAQWTETQSSVTVKSGYLSVHLGVVTPFPSTIDWSEQQWLTMNVNTDGEMSPRLQLTSVPAAFHANEADGLRSGANVLGADDFAQLAPTTAQVINSAVAALRLNQTGAGGLLQLQNGGNDIFAVANNGDVTSDGSATFEGGTLNLGTASQLGGLVLNDGSGNTGTIRTAALGQNTTYTLPDPGTANVNICLSTGNCGGTGDISQGGNSFGVPVTIGSNDAFSLNFETGGITRLTLDTSGNANLTGALTAGTGLTVTTGGANITGNSSITGTLSALTGLSSSGTVTFSGLGAGLVQSSTGGVLSSGAVDRNSATFFSNALNVANGGTGAATFASNGVLYGNGTGALQAAAAGTSGQILIADASGVPTFRTVSGDATISDTGVVTITSIPNNSVALGTDTTGDYVQNLGALTGLSTTGNSGEGSTPTLSVLYGSAANTAVQGSTTLVCPSGTGNLSGTGNTITLGTGGTCNALDTNAAVTFATSVTTPIITSAGGLAISSGGSGGISLDSASNVISIAANDTTLQRTASGVYSIDLNDAAATTLRLINSDGTGVANLNLADGGLQIGGTAVLSGARALSNLTGISTTGALVFNSFGGSAGILTVDGSGNVSVSAASGFEVPLTFDNGLTRTGNNIKLGGALTGLTDIATGSNNLTLSGNGFIGIGSTSAQYKLDVRTPGSLAAQVHISSTNTDAGGYLTSVNDFQLLASGGAAFNGTNTIAKATAATIFGSNVSGSFVVQSNSGLTVGASYTPTNRLVINASSGLASFTNNVDINGGTLGSSASGFTLLADPTTVTAFGAATTLSLGISTGTTTINGNTLTSTGLTFVGAGATTIQAANNQNLTVNTQGSGVLGLNTGSTGILTTNASTIQRSGSSLTFDVANAGLSTLNVSNSNGSNLANLDVSGGIFAGNGNAFSVNSDGDLTSVFTALNGTSTANGGSGLGTSTSLTLTSAANFDIGNYVQMNSANCGGTGINPCYAKITNKAGNVLTITPALRWTTGATVNEYHIPEIGGTNALDTLTNRYGRGYFISGVATGNGTTFYNEDSIETSLTAFDLLNTAVTTLNFGGAATTLNIGNASGTTTFAGNVNFTGNVTAPGSGTSGYLTRTGTTLAPANSGDNFSTSGNLVTTGSGTITSAGLLTVQGGGASISGGLSLLTGALNLTSGGITNAGSLAGVAGITFTSGSLNLASGGITNAGPIAGATTINASGAITAATSSNTINGLIINSGALSGISTINATGAITAATSSNTINNLVINSGALSSVTGITFTSGGLNLSSGGITNAGNIGGVAGLTLASGNLALGGGNITGLGTNLTASAGLTVATSGSGDLTFDSASNVIILEAGETTLRRVAAGNYTIELNSASASALLLNNTGAGAASLVLTDGDLSTGSTPTIRLTNAGALTNITGLTLTSGSINAGSGGITNAGSIGGVAGLTFTSGSLNLASGGITNTGSIAGATTINASGAITAATSSNTINNLVINSGALSNVAGITFTSGSLNLASGGITNGGAFSGITTLGLSGAITGATSTNTINGLIINVGSVSGITGYTQTSGNFSISGSGTFGTGTGAISLNGATSVTGTNTLTVGTGLASLGGALTTTGLATFNDGLTMQTGDTFTFNGDAFTDLTSNGLIVSSGVLTLDVTTAGTVAATGSNSGLVTAADGLSLLRGCSNNQILKWSTTGPQWNCAADATGISDARLKKNIVVINDDLLDRIATVQLYKFDYDCAHPAFQSMHCDTDHQEAGVIAQELAQVFPELVMEVNGYYQVRYNALSLYNLKAVGELARKVDTIDSTSGDTTNGVQTGGTVRVDQNGALKNITGLNMLSGGASLSGGIDNNSGGITNAGNIEGAAHIGAQNITLTADAAANLLTLVKDSKGVFTVFNDGSLELKLDSSKAFAVKDAAGINIFNIDSLTGRVSIGSGDSSKTVLFTLDNRSLPDDPPGTDGSSYYNTSLNRFRCYQAGKWQDCLPAGDLTDPIALDKTVWLQPSADQEFPGTPRILPNLERAHEFRLRLRLTSPGAAGATCRLQYAATDAGPWSDLSATGTGELSIAQNGTLKTDWFKLADDARHEDIVIRVMCKGGDGARNAVFYGLSIQLR